MVMCPECEADLDIEEGEVDEGEVISCPECGNDYEVVTALLEAAREAGARHHLGIIRAVDALYSDLVPDIMPDGPKLKAELEMWAKAGVVANDMESSTLFVVASVRRLRAGSLLLVVDEVGAGEIHHLDPAYMERMLKVAVEAVRRLIERDAARK